MNEESKKGFQSVNVETPQKNEVKDLLLSVQDSVKQICDAHDSLVQHYLKTITALELRLVALSKVLMTNNIITSEGLRAEIRHEELLNLMDQERQFNAKNNFTLVDRPSQEGDLLVVSFSSTMADTNASEPSLQSEWCHTSLGDNEYGLIRLLPEIEKELIGVKAGDKKSVTFTFPDDYRLENLRGKTATFEFNILSVKAKSESSK